MIPKMFDLQVAIFLSQYESTSSKSTKISLPEMSEHCTLQSIHNKESKLHRQILY